MTVMNLYMKEGEKENLKELAEKAHFNSVSEFVRTLINDRMTIENTAVNRPDLKIEIPDYIPKNHYVVFAMDTNKILAVAKTPSEATEIAVDK